MRYFFTLLLISTLHFAHAQSGCPGCVTSLPDTLADDALFLDSLDSGQAGVPYDQTLSFRLPMTTTPVAEAGFDIPAGIPIGTIEIESVLGVPPGLNWELSNDEFMVSDSTDGCVRICGTPLIPGFFEVEVQLRAFVGPLSSPASVVVPLLIEPEVVNNDGFSIVNASGCGEVTAVFVNNNPSNGADGFSYLWDFDNGTSSFEEDPAPVTYSDPGTYIIEYQAVIDTSAYTLIDVTVLGAGCDDAFGGNPDIYINVFDPDNVLLFTSTVDQNTDFPVSFPLAIEIGDGTYSVQVVDEDSGLGGGDDDCGTIEFTRDDQGLFTEGPLSISIDIFRSIDTIEVTDTVIVFPQPDDPLIDPSGMVDFCSDEVAELFVANYDSNLVWTLDGTTLEDTDSLLVATEPGSYVASFQNADGCTAVSDTVFVSFLPEVPPTPLTRDGTTVATENLADVPPGTSFTWLLDGQPFNETTLRFCPTINGTYTLLVTDDATGCSIANEIEVTDADVIVCNVAVEEILSGEGWVIYPNPSEGLAFLKTPEGLAGNWQLELYDQLGRQVWQREQGQLSVTQNLEMDWNGLPPGSYRLLARSESAVVVLSVMRQ
ncbi:MAG: hypothetical protein AAF741_01930 [Bacteroidota bacterium]